MNKKTQTERINFLDIVTKYFPDKAIEIDNIICKYNIEYANKMGLQKTIYGERIIPPSIYQDLEADFGKNLNSVILYSDYKNRLLVNNITLDAMSSLDSGINVHFSDKVYLHKEEKIIYLINLDGQAQSDVDLTRFFSESQFNREALSKFESLMVGLYEKVASAHNKVELAPLTFYPLQQYTDGLLSQEEAQEMMKSMAFLKNAEDANSIVIEFANIISTALVSRNKVLYKNLEISMDENTKIFLKKVEIKTWN